MPHFYFRDEEVRDAYNRPATRPLFSDNPRDAHRFHSEEGVTRFLEHFKSLFPKYRFYAETVGGFGPLFEKQPTISTEDKREPLYIEPDGYEGSGLVFIVRPAITMHGAVWCIRSRDIPSLAVVHTCLETVYSTDAIDCIRQMQQRWAKFNPLPFRPVELDAADSIELKKFVDEIHQNQPTSRVRPGSAHLF